MDDYAANVIPGVGAVARWEAGLVIAGGGQDRSLELIAELQNRLGESPTSGALIELLRNGPRFDTAEVHLAAAVSTPDGVRVFLRGDMEVRTERDESITGPAPVERDLPPIALWLGSGDPPTSQGHAVMDLQRGVVTGRGVVIHRTTVDVAPADDAAQPAPASPQYPVAPPPPEPVAGANQPDRPFEVIDWDPPDAAVTRQPLAVLTENADQTDPTDLGPGESGHEVLGIRCSRSHFNNPKASYCQVCGISMVHITHRLEPGVRPTLGFVVFADGATYAIDRPYLIGRGPVSSMESGFTYLATQDATQSVSREHAELRLDNWDVVYVDLGSTNGSFLWNVSAARWDPIPPDTPVVLQSGMTVSVGRMTFVFEGASRAIGAT